MSRYYSAREASERLGVSRNTLYAYVSRGLIRSEPIGGAKKANRYHALDVDQLATRSEIHKAPQKALRKAMDWGAPLLESSITLISDEAFYYRGQPVLELATEHPFENTIKLLWEGDSHMVLAPDPVLREEIDRYLKNDPAGEPLELFLGALGMLNHQDIRAFSFTRDSTIMAGKTILIGFLRVLTGEWPTGAIASHLGQFWGIAGAHTHLIDSALTLVADHELNISSFIARCTASAGCSPYAAVASATHAFFGRRHGGNSERIAGLLYEADGRGSLYEAIAARVKGGDPVPGFGHRLYNVDPRARFLFQRMPDSKGYVASALAASDVLLKGAFPTIDFALVVLEKELNLPDRSGVYLFYLGRLTGLVAHVMEQYGQNHPIRPRAQYVGVRPQR